MPRDLLQSDTIAAIATPPGEGGIGIIRLSGPDAPRLLDSVWRGRRLSSEFQSHCLYYGEIFHPGENKKIDEGLAVWMKAPNSYTAEEVVEIHAHGGPLVLNQILEAIIQLGARVAEPGEFTRRAFLNGKLDLLQAEGVGELIHAKSEAALRNARAQLEGRLSEEVGRFRNQVVALLARVEAAIDFPEEEIEIISPNETLGEVELLLRVLQEWVEKFHLGRLVREGVRVALVGRPNVGKSTLLNRLLGEEKAIVHHQPGTTRDVVEGVIEIGGVSFQLFDTAGIRDGEGEVEREGIERSRKAARCADLTLWVLDVSNLLNEEDRHILKTLGGKVLVVGNKMDLGVQTDSFPKGWGNGEKSYKGEWVFVSAKSAIGLAELKDRILQEVGLEGLVERGFAFLNNARHRDALRRAVDSLSRAQRGLKETLSVELIAADLRGATDALEGLLGRVTPDDLLDKIFSEFCLGK